MNDQRVQAEIAEARRLQLKRRVKRVIVAGYIHELSARHQEDTARRPEPRERLLASPQTG